MEDLPFMAARELSALYRSKRLSPVELVQATLGNIDRRNPELNAYRVVDHVSANEGARQSEQRWMKGCPLSEIDGIPFGVKDLLLAKGHSTLFGSRARLPSPDTTIDAPAVARLREHGAVFLGKTTTSEFGWKGTADSPLTGITRNPWNPSMTSGGSSGGAAVAAAAGMGVFQLGTDGGGSVRIPASFTGVCGMKATFGRVPAWPPGPMMTLSNVGPIARTVDDMAAILNAITKPDPRDWYALPPQPIDFMEEDVEGLKGKRFALHLGSSHAATDIQVEQALRGLALRIEEVGGFIDEVALPFDELFDLFSLHWYAGAQHLVRQIPEERRPLVDQGLADAARQGEQLQASKYYSAMIERQGLGEKLQGIVGNYDALITPSVPILPFEAGLEWPADRAYKCWMEWACFLYPFNLSRQPALSIPIGLSNDGLPIGAQIAGALYHDKQIVQIARAIERVLPRYQPTTAPDGLRE